MGCHDLSTPLRERSPMTPEVVVAVSLGLKPRDLGLSGTPFGGPDEPQA